MKCMRMLILYKKPRPQHYTSDDYSVYKAIVAQTRVIAFPNKRPGSARPRSTWKHMLSGMVIPGDMVEEEDEESTEGISSDGYRKKKKTREPFSKGYGVVYLPGDINELTDKLHLLLAEFLAGNTTVRNELDYVLDTRGYTSLRLGYQ